MAAAAGGCGWCRLSILLNLKTLCRKPGRYGPLELELELEAIFEPNSGLQGISSACQSATPPTEPRIPAKPAKLVACVLRPGLLSIPGRFSPARVAELADALDSG